MRLWDAAGYLASGLVVMAFCMRDIIPLRVVALTSNVPHLWNWTRSYSCLDPARNPTPD